VSADVPRFHVASCPHASVGVRPFVLGGQLRLGVVVKVTLDLSQQLARVIPPLPILTSGSSPAIGTRTIAPSGASPKRMISRRASLAATSP
jgi:hypothetical protein